MSEYLDLPEKSAAILLTFRYGPADLPLFVRLTNLQNDLIFQGNVYQSLPAMEIDLAPNVGTLDAKPTKITLPTRVSDAGLQQFITDISHDRPFALTKLYIQKLLYKRGRTAGIERIYHLRTGRMGKRRRNPSGKPGIVEIELIEPKTELKKKMGVRIDQYCQANFGFTGCGLDARRIITGLDFIPPNSWPLQPPAKPYPPRACQVYMSQYAGRGFAVRIEPTTNGLRPWFLSPILNYSGSRDDSFWWQHGYFEKDGLRIKVREWQPHTYFFILGRQPPPSWDGATDGIGVLYPGCGKLSGDCDNWENISGFNDRDGFMCYGLAVPPYNPAAAEGDK